MSRCTGSQRDRFALERHLADHFLNLTHENRLWTSVWTNQTSPDSASFFCGVVSILIRSARQPYRATKRSIVVCLLDKRTGEPEIPCQGITHKCIRGSQPRLAVIREPKLSPAFCVGQSEGLDVANQVIEFAYVA